MRLILVEDEEKLARFVVRGLRAERYAVDHVENGADALSFLSRFEYDLVILDLNLPLVTGDVVLRQLRKSNTTIPVLVLTARDAVSDKVRVFEDGADDYLTKPFSFAELLVRIKALLRRGTVTRANVVKVADLQLDRVAHQVRRNTDLIQLTAKEFALLEYLMVNAGRVLSRTMIVEHVWDQSFEGFTNIVDVYVRQLRKKIDEAYPLKLIRTVRGVGYSITEEPAK